jgi:hypothetical protein
MRGREGHRDTDMRGREAERQRRREAEREAEGHLGCHALEEKWPRDTNIR